MIDLLNRRYVCFFFNVGEDAPGYDADAANWLKQHKLSNVYSGVFSTAGKMLKQLPNTGDKHEYFNALRAQLDKNPDFDKPTEAEQELIDAAATDDADEADKFAAARVYEELGKYALARPLYEATAEGKLRGGESLLALARMWRQQQKWDKAEPYLKKLDENKRLAPDVAMERGYALLAAKKYDEARKLLVAAIKADAKSRVIGELHYYAGVASLYLKRQDWANYHWYYIINNLENDRHYQRAWLSVAVKAIPFPFAELPGQGMRGGMVTHDSANKARDKAEADYEKLKDAFDTDDYWKESKEAEGEKEKPTAKPPEPKPEKDEAKEEEF